MASVSIGTQNQNDASYRYKMPKLIAKVEGRGNGIKTVIVNMVDIAKALHVEPAYPTKYFGIELGAQSKFDRATERAVVNGRHDQPDLATLLDKFIQTFVLCPNCHLPEISMHVGKNTIKIDCAACGHNAPLATNHKLTTYIVKNPPADNGKKSKSADASGKGKKKKEPKDGDAEEEPEEETTEDAPAEEKKVAVAVSEKDIEWFTDTSDEAAQKRKEAEFEEMVKAKASAKSANPEAAALASIKDLHKEPPEVVLRLFLSQQKREVNEVVSELRRLQLARGLDDTQKIQVLLRAIINAEEVKKVPKQFSSHAPLLKQFAKDRPASLQLIGCVEEYVGVQEKALLKYVAHIFKALYEADVLEEEVLVSWYESPPESSWLVQRDVAVNIRKKAKPFIEWLRNAEEESEEED